MGSMLQRPGLTVRRDIRNFGGSTFSLASRSHDYMEEIFLDGSVTPTFALPPPGLDNFLVGKAMRVYNTHGSANIVTQVPAGTFCGGEGGYADQRGSSSAGTGATLPPKSMQILSYFAPSCYAWYGPFTSGYAG